MTTLAYIVSAGSCLFAIVATWLTVAPEAWPSNRLSRKEATDG